MEGILRTFIDAALDAGEIIMKYYSLPLSERGLSYKEDQSPVTRADQEANQCILDRICGASCMEQLGDYGVLAEESRDDLSRLEKDWCVIIDPLDGTKEFIAGLPEFTVNIALVYQGEPVLGVVYAPATQELFYARRGGGAFKAILPAPETRIFVSPRKTDLIAMHSRYHLDDKTKALLERHRDRFASVITAGSSLKVCRIAEGKADVYYRFGYTMEWDTCAEQLIVEEAGGFLLEGHTDRPIVYNRQDPCNRYGFYVVNCMENCLERLEINGNS
ncbi:MAG: 3'(2'),5'-bisphosphate nucleotidase CysQ [Clostridia bacterium]|nr:3'(2'),5'-bisphosphate nucleotidase CysQ [Clostridia bacterium]